MCEPLSGVRVCVKMSTNDRVRSIQRNLYISGFDGFDCCSCYNANISHILCVFVSNILNSFCKA